MRSKIANQKPTPDWYKWVIIACSFLMIFICLGFCSSNKGIYLAPMTSALGIKRSLYSLSGTCRYLSTSVINIFFGALIAKFGSRKLIGAGFAALLIHVILSAVATNALTLCISGCFLGIGLSWTTTTMVGYVVNCWCPEHKGTIMGIILCANGVGSALATQIVTPIIYEEGNPFGYRNAYWLIAVILLITAIVVVSLFRNAPVYDSNHIPKKKAKAGTWEGISFDQASKKSYFYTLLVCIFFTGAALTAVGSFSSAHMTDVGIDSGLLATVVSFHALTLSGAKFLAGFSTDRLGLRKTVLICNIAGVIAFTALSFVSSSPTGISFAFIYSTFSSLALPLETIMLPLIAAHVFGEKSFGKVLGIFVSVNTFGYAVGSPLANIVYDTFGTYRPVLIASTIVFAALAIEMQRIFTVVDREQKVAMAASEKQ